MALSTLRNLFAKTTANDQSAERTNLVGPRIPRHSTGWSAMLKHLKDENSLCVLDIGPTSPSNINFLTAMGHSLYMADVILEAQRGNWPRQPTEEELPVIEAEIEAFFAKNMNFGGRLFDAILLWTTLDYLPPALIDPMVSRLYSSLKPGGRVLAFFHTKTTGPESIFYRYHVTETDTVEMQEAHRLAVPQVYTNRKIEQLFSAYQGCRFFLAKDNVYEVIITR